MKRRWTKEKQEKLLAVFLTLGLIAAVIPLLIISHYNFKSVDDYSYAVRSEPVWRETHSLLRLFWSQILVSIDMWKKWQGIYFGDWMMTTALGLWGTNGYYMCAYLTIGGLIAGELFAADVILRRGLGASRSRTLTAAVPCILLQVLLIPSPAEGFYWMCGSVLYTFTYALSVVFVAILTIYLMDHDASRRRRRSLETLIVVFTFMMGGCTYPTGLGLLLILFCMTAWCFYRKKRQRWVMACNTCLYLGFFLLNVLSPGAAARQRAAGAGMGAAAAVAASLREAVLYIKSWTALPILLTMVFLAPVFWGIAGKRRGGDGKESKFAFRYPALVTLLSFGIYAAHFTPCLYALEMIGPYRVQNLYRFLLYVWLFGNELYWLGWLRRVWKGRDGEKTAAAARFYFPAGVLATALVGLSLLWYAGDKLTTVSALLSLRRGEAAAYHEEYRQRLAVLEDASVREVYLKPFACKPYLLYFGDVGLEPENWVNTAVAEYYGKDFVRLAD